METLTLNSISEIRSLLTCRNQVLVRRVYDNLEDTTPAGIIKAVDPSFRPNVHADRISEVVMVPEGLYYYPPMYKYKQATESIDWDTDMELRVGDIVWHTFMELSDTYNIKVRDSGELYKLLRYEDFYLAKRGEELIMLNGYVLCEEVLRDRLGALDVLEREVDTTLGRVALLGNRNRAYRIRGGAKDLDGNDILKVGDIIVKRNPKVHIRLEEDVHAKFPLEKKMYFIIQRRDIFAVIDKQVDVNINLVEAFKDKH